MNTDELSTLQQLLLERRLQLMREGDVALEPVRDDPASKIDEDAAPLTEMNQVIASRRNKLRALELQRIDAALQRIATSPDTVGECTLCEEPIGMGRLRVMPWAHLCVSCQARQSPISSGRRRHLADYDD